jgi:PAS domain S-box-containing protein
MTESFLSEAAGTSANRQELSLLAQFIEKVPGAAYIREVESGRNLFVNRSGAALLGLEPNEILDYGAEFAQNGMHADDTARRAAHERELLNLQDGETIEFEYRLRQRRTGEWRWFLSRESVFRRNEQGNPELVIGTAHDITERKKTEAALMESEKRFRQVAESKLFGVAFGDFDGGIHYVNDSFLEMTGYTRDDFDSGRVRWTEITPPEHLHLDHKAASELLATGICTPFEKEYLRKDGSRVPILIGGALMPSANGQKPEVFTFYLDLTERKKAEDALRESEERLRLATEAARIYSWQYDMTTGQASYSANVREVLGFDLPNEVEEAIKLVHDDDRAATLASFEAGLEGKQPIYIEFRYVNPETGETVWALLQGTLVRDKRNQPVRAIGITQNITERRRAEEKLRESTAILSAVSEATPSLIFAKDREGRLISVNPAVTKLLGKPAEELLGKLAVEYMPNREQAAAVDSNDRRIIEGGKTVVFEEQVTTPEIVRTYLSTKTPFRDGDGNIVGLIGVGSDITEIKRAEEALRESARRQAALFRLADQLHRAATHEDVYGAALAAVTSALGCERASILLYDETGIMRFAAWRGLPESYRRAAEGHSPWQPDEKNPQPICLADIGAAEIDESLKAVIKSEGIAALAFIPLVSNGRLIGKFMAYFDEPRHLEESERELSLTIARQLAFGIERKKSEEENRRLLESEQAARRDAENANRLKDEFLATVSHELRTPLNAILGWSTMVRQNNFDEATMRRAFEVTERNARNQNQIISDILDVSRIITGKLHLNLQPVALASLVEAAVETVRPLLAAKNLSLTLDLAGDDAMIAGDAERLQQIVWNLLTNAVKFTPDGGEIAVRLRRAETDALLTVADNGDGIEPDFLPFVFDRFRQADGKTNRRHGGLGLGLAIVRHLTEMHGGSVRVDSGGAGSGARFTIRLPKMI